MKAIFNITLLCMLMLTFTACTKEDVPEQADVTFIFEHVVDEQGLAGDTPFTYTNLAGNPYNVSNLSYVVTKMVLIDQSLNEVTIETTNTMSLGGGQIGPITLPNGTYQSMELTVNSYVHQGKFIDNSSAEQNISIDYSGGGAEQIITFPVGGLKVNGAAKSAYLSFNLNAVYDAGTDFNNGATEAEVTPNLGGAFTFAGSFEN